MGSGHDEMRDNEEMCDLKSMTGQYFCITCHVIEQSRPDPPHPYLSLPWLPRLGTLLTHRRLLAITHHTRHEFYETDEKLTLTIFDRDADPTHINVKFQPRSVCPLLHTLTDK